MEQGFHRLPHNRKEAAFDQTASFAFRSSFCILVRGKRAIEGIVRISNNLTVASKTTSCFGATGCKGEKFYC